MDIKCNVCGATLIHRKIDDGFVSRSISKDGKTKIITQKSNGSDEIRCSKNAEHEISDDMNEKVMNIIWKAEAEESKAIENQGKKKFAKCVWTADDIQVLRPRWSLKKCEEFLEENSKYIQEATVQAGWGAIENLL